MNNQTYRNLSEKNILIAEDNETDRLLLKCYFGGTGANLYFASDGEEAVNIFKNNSIDLVLMDIRMPIKDGKAARKEIADITRANIDKYVPIIAHTAIDPNQENLEGFDYCLRKPCTMDKVLGIVDASLSNIFQTVKKYIEIAKQAELN